MRSLLPGYDGVFLPQFHETGARVASSPERAVEQAVSPRMPSASRDSLLGQPEETSLPSKNFMSHVESHDQTLFWGQRRPAWPVPARPLLADGWRHHLTFLRLFRTPLWPALVRGQTERSSGDSKLSRTGLSPRGGPSNSSLSPVSLYPSNLERWHCFSLSSLIKS